MAVATQAPTTVSPPRRRERLKSGWVLPVYSILMIFYLTIHVFLMILYGFNDLPGNAERQTTHFWGFTLHWYLNPFQDPQLTEAFWRSIRIAGGNVLLATPIGALLGLALGRYWFRVRASLNFVIFLAIAVPEIVLGSSLLTLFIEWSQSPQLSATAPPLGWRTLLLSHVSFSIPFVAVTVRARVAGMDRSLEEAGQDLFATPVVTFFKVTLPLILPGIFAGALLAFVLSLDDFVISNFVVGRDITFPLWVYGATKIGLPPTVNVIGTYLFLTGVILAVVTALLQRRRV